MRLLTRAVLLQLAPALLLVLISSVAGYRALQHEMGEELDEALLREAQMWQQSAKQNPDLLTHQFTGGMGFRVLGKGRITSPALADTLLVVQEDGHSELEPYRIVTFQVSSADGNYLAQLGAPVVLGEELANTLTKYLVALLLLLTVSWVGISLIMNRQLWLPFRKSLAVLQTFRPEQTNSILLANSSITEFADLNNVLMQLTQHIQADFIRLRNFTTTAAHELQTPIASAHAQLEVLLQNPALTVELAAQASEAAAAIKKLQRIHKGLLTLTQIESGLHEGEDSCDIAIVLREQVKELAEVFEAKGIALTLTMPNAVVLRIPHVWGYMLVGNLLRNIAVHADPTKPATITLTETELTTVNHAPAPNVDTTLLLERFQKGNAAGPTLGLGLAIVDAICSAQGFTLQYDYTEGTHKIAVRWS